VEATVIVTLAAVIPALKLSVLAAAAGVGWKYISLFQ